MNLDDLDELMHLAVEMAVPFRGEPELYAFVQMMTSTGLITAHANRFNTKGFRFRSYELLALEYGTVRAEPLFFPDEYGVWQPQQCYDNAHRLAMLYPELTYVEGYAFFTTMPVQHAWVEREGQILDPTWANVEHETTYETPIYCGVPFSTDYLLRNTARTGWASILACDWRFNSTKLECGFVTDEAGMVIDDLPAPALTKGAIA